MDKLIVKGLGKNLDGEYEFDLAGLLTLGHPETLTNREGHRIKVMAGVRAGQLEEALQQGDNDVLVALAAIVLSRHGKRFDEEVLWDSPMGSGLDFEIEAREETGDEESPPEQTATDSPSNAGGVSSSPETSESPENGQSPTGFPLSETPSSVPGSDLETLAS